MVRRARLDMAGPRVWGFGAERMARSALKARARSHCRCSTIPGRGRAWHGKHAGPRSAAKPSAVTAIHGKREADDAWSWNPQLGPAPARPAPRRETGCRRLRLIGG